MKAFPLLILLFLPMLIIGQVGIGTTNPNAQLDVVTDGTATSERKGLQVDINSTSLSTAQNCGITTSARESFNTGTRVHEIHNNDWVSNNNVTILNAYLLVRSQ